ncbi:LytTR family DNA-binding domain-containing protein [Phenylobacterium aquaticum]|uniref:LytTR family DNA-binding domain-containing protein n=1 Tax=Phenylobacterium aquaticum TaxID=1763816 RepID=UPI0026EBA812|nr:LytTR family DNA-binding domain-containing protein [Phenylobacterium aquaticum]
MRLSDVISDPTLWARRLTRATVVGLALGVVGPFGSYLNDSLVARMAYWTALLWLGTLILSLGVGLAMVIGLRWRLPRAFAIGVGIILSCAPLAAVAALIGRTAWPRHTDFLSPLDWYSQTLFVAAPLVIAMLWFEGRVASPPPPTAGAPDDPRLPARLRDQALCLQMEDHYVRIHTPAGSDLVLMPMREAIAALGGLEGLQVHRSWWVARRAVTQATPLGRAASLTLTNGLVAPVARNRIAELRARGWLD